MNIHLILQMAAEAMAEREALVCGNIRMSYADLNAAAHKLAAQLKPGEKMAYLAENHPVFPAALFAAALAGTEFIPMNYRLADEQISALMARIRPRNCSRIKR